MLAITARSPLPSHLQKYTNEIKLILTIMINTFIYANHFTINRQQEQEEGEERRQPNSYCTVTL